MRYSTWFAMALAGGSLFYGQQAAAHAYAGSRLFPVTLTIDDPGVADEASIPTFQWNLQDTDSGRVNAYDFDFEFDKRITKDFGIGIAYGGFGITQPAGGGGSQFGWHNLELSAKYQLYVNPEHELLVSVGVTHEFGSTGTTNVGDFADPYGSTQPTIYAGKGFGDLPIGLLRPLAVTGFAGYQIADRRLKVMTDPDTGDTVTNNGAENRFNAGFSIQYSMPYLQSQVKDFGLPDFFNRLFPVVEFSWSAPASAPSATPTQFLIAPGVIYVGDGYQVGIEALIPGNAATGSHVGVIAQFHVFLDDLFPNSLGKPIVDW